MPHPNGGVGNIFPTTHTFAQAYAFVGAEGCEFESTTNERIFAKRSMAEDGLTTTIVFFGKTGRREGNVCSACWGFRQACTKTRIGQYVKGLDRAISR